MKKYLLAVDGSANAQRAAQFLIDLVQCEKEVEIIIIHIVNAKKEIYNFSPFTDYKEIERMVINQGREIAENQAKLFENEQIQVKKVVAAGDPGYEIAEYARHENCDQIVIGTRGLSNLKGLVLGSVSHKVIHFAHCPVTLVK
ncbi:universal stress protein [Desulfoscipio gibsoniae]|uniref:Universal stress protein UspA-like protein n=1 Tax=Desulfoscipio gibsoniae DSM 7213 TaxID=767817 RepID=R4KPG8_9FIRM|nr:universal stress protein [Desulfoscipio gibsoniae]AGL01526.1 universal stress protein UspA-like protein [Desulfoscipio gibsoniae DSM 7213]